MFEILTDKTICITRGDIANLDVSAKLKDGLPYLFHKGDVVRLQIFKKNECASVVVKKDVVVAEECESVDIYLTSADTRFGEAFNRPVEYWYEVVVNPDTAPKTIIGYDKQGPKVFCIYPEGVSK